MQPPPSTAGGLLVDVDTNVRLPHRRLRPHGELDLATAPLLASILDEQATGCEQIELDHRELIFCDLIGLTALEQAQQRLRDRSCQLSVQGLSGQLRRLLDLDGLPTTLSTPPSPTPTTILARPRRRIASLVAGLLRRQ